MKTNLIISVLFLVLAGFVYVYEIKGGETRREAAQRARQLAEFSDHEVRRLRIDRGDTALVIEKEGDVWRLAAPVATGADAGAVERYLRALREAEVEGDPVMDSAAAAAAPGRLADYGLDAPRLRVVVEGTDGTRLDTLRFGDDTPTDRYTYVQRGGANPEVLRVRAWRYDNVDKSLFDLRDRRLLAFEVDQVRRLRLHRPGEGDIEVARTDGGWRLVAPLARRADEAAVGRILTSLQSARTQTIVAEAPADSALEAFGLAPGVGALELTLWLGEDLAEKRLQVGSEVPGGGAFGRDSSRPHVFDVDSTVVSRLRTSLVDLRDKRVLRVAADSVTSLEVHRDGEVAFSAARDSSDGWRLTSHPERPAKTWRLNSLLTDLDALEARSFAADAPSADQLDLSAFGLDAPQAVVEVEMADGSRRRLLVGRRDGSDAHLMAADVPSVAVVDDDVVESLIPSLDDVATMAAADAAADAEGGADASATGE